MWGTRSTSHIVSSLTVEELRSYYEVLENIDLKLMDKPDEFTLDREHNSMFFTREQLSVGLRFPVPALVKQFFTSPRRCRPLSILISFVSSLGAMF